MIRTFCWILGFCTLCVVLFFRPDPVNANGTLTWTFTEIDPEPVKPDTPLPKTYAEARERALRTGKPLVVWVGEAICPGCVQRTKEEFVHWVTPTFPDTPKDALVVGVAERGELIRVGTMTAWPEGHLTTVRKALDLYRTHKQTTDQRSTPYRGVQTQQTYQPAIYSGYGGYSKASYGGSRGRGRSGGC